MHQQSRQDQQMQNMLRMLMQLRALKQDRTQWEQGQAMKQQELSLDKDELASIDRARRASEKQATARHKYEQAQMKRWGKELTPEEQMAHDIEKLTKQEEVKARFRTPTATKPKSDPRIKNRLGIVEDAIDLYEGTLKDLKEDMTTDPTVLNNINYALEELYGAKTRLGDAKLMEGDRWNKVRRIASSPSYVKSGGFLPKKKKTPRLPKAEFVSSLDLPPGTQTATNPKTGEKVALVNGKWIPIK